MSTPDAPPSGRARQLLASFDATRKIDSRAVPLTAGIGLAVLVVFVVVGLLVGPWWLWTVLGVVLGLMGALLVAVSRISGAALRSIEGKPGAAAAVLGSVRGYRVTPAVQASRKGDFVHRAVGRSGVVLVGEGAPARTKQLLIAEKRRVTRVVGDAPVHDLVVGEGAGTVTLGELQAQLARLPKKLKAGQVDDLDTRLKALGGPTMPLPKGPIPRARPR